MPVYKDDNTNTYYFKVNYKQDGQYKQKLRRGFQTKKAANAAMAEMQNELNKGTFVQPTRDLLSGLMETWLQDRRQRVKPRTAEAYELLIRGHVLPVLGHLRIADITPRLLQDMYNAMNASGSLSPGNVKKCHILIKSALARAVEWDLLRKNPAGAVDSPRIPYKEMKYWTREQALAFLAAARSHRHYAAFHLALSTGMRRGEILGLRWQDVDLDARMLTIRQIYYRGEIQAGAKTASGVRSIGLDVPTVEALRALRARTELERRDAGDVYADHDLVTCTPTGSPIDASNLRDYFRTVISRAGVPVIRFHDLRHTHVVMLLQARENSKRIAERLGWSSVKMIDRYAHVMPDMRQETADLFGAAFYGQ